MASPSEVPDRTKDTLRALLVPSATTPAMQAWATIELMRAEGLNPRSYTASEAHAWAMEQACPKS